MLLNKNAIYKIISILIPEKNSIRCSAPAKTGDIAMCHLIFFIPFFALPVFWLMPFNAALTIYLAIYGICFFTYFKIYQAMRMKSWNGKEAMLAEPVLSLRTSIRKAKSNMPPKSGMQWPMGKSLRKGIKLSSVGLVGD